MQPTPYSRQFNFSGYEGSNPGANPPADKLDSEFNALKVSLDQVDYNLALIQRDDGQLANQSVGLVQLKPEVLAYFGVGGTYSGTGTGGSGSGGGNTYVSGGGALYAWQLLDMPHSWTGLGGQVLVVSPDGSGVTTEALPSASTNFKALTDAFSSFSGKAGYTVRIDSTATVLEAVNITIVPGASYARCDQNQDWGGFTQTNLVTKKAADTFVDLGASVSGTVAIDPANGMVIRGTIAGSVNWTFTGLPPAGEVWTLEMVLENAGAFTHSWPAGTDWGGSTTSAMPTLNSTGWSVLAFQLFADGLTIAVKVR